MVMGIKTGRISLGFRNYAGKREEKNRSLDDLKRVYGVAGSAIGAAVIRVALPWEGSAWDKGWPNFDPQFPDRERLSLMFMRASPDNYILGTVKRNIGDTDFHWSVNDKVLTENIIGEWHGTYRTELDCKLTVDRILRENQFKLLEEKHLLLG